MILAKVDRQHQSEDPLVVLHPYLVVQDLALFLVRRLGLVLPVVLAPVSVQT
jgi:hypothetical protein